MRRTKRWAGAVVAVSAITLTPLVLSATTGVATGLAATTSHGAKIAVQRVGNFKLSAGGASAGELRPPSADDVAGTVKAVANRSPHSRSKLTRGTPPLSGISPTQTLGVSSDGSSTGWRGINHYDQRTTDGGNQWSLVPPDQALCANSTQVVEAVNNALAVYDTAGNELTELRSINQLYWGDHEVLRGSSNVASPHQMGDPSCVYDAGSDRFFLTVYDAVSDSAGNPTGPSFIDIAVSPAGSAVGTWKIYQLDTTDDGTNGTQNHSICDGAAGGCFGDYPHLGTDANGLYITTNEYPTFGAGYGAAQVYAISKSGLVAGTAKVPGAQWDTSRWDLYQGTYYNGFTIAPAVSDGTSYATANNGTMYFLSSDSWAADNPIVSHQVLVWSLTGTAGLAGSDSSGLSLAMRPVAVPTGYYPPPASNQKAGSTPLAACLNNTACSKAVLGQPDKYKEYEYSFDSSDTRMLQSAYANGKLWGALDTAVDVTGSNGVATKAGVAYYVVDPTDMSLVKSGTVAVPDNNISYPALGVTPDGNAVMALTLTGKDYYPSAGYVRLDDQPDTTASGVRVVGAGQSPADDFSGYRGFLYNRPRWGDYGAAAVVGDTVWIASEYIAQRPCSLSQFEQTQFTCGDGQRTALANWATHVAAVSTS
jgi:hypothetical protein